MCQGWEYRFRITETVNLKFFIFLNKSGGICQVYESMMEMGAKEVADTLFLQ